ncbi:MAG: radical SAM protein [Rhodospirillales bacterium RIFCSPLOWO2_12_FULL_58_28]|nr:MAG: radical SAM protein [Rhodospirillales bacterium RIFCSPLOWO2_02_FULL_58_16]OHC78447.1 MAG: radical SAM protein [Rhodospirillales bacterium RIFCSPLOWO2_12_FULL_58_28]
MLHAERVRIDPRKFRDPDITAKGEQRAVVALTRLKTLWFNVGSLCNIACKNCYMDSSPKNDRLAYITTDEADRYLDEVAAEGLPVEEIAFTGGEPFMNPQFLHMTGAALGRGYRVLILTNAMKPMWNRRRELLKLKERYGDRLSVRVSIDHYAPERHEAIRGEGSWEPVLRGLKWLAENGFNLAVAGRTCWGEDEGTARSGYAALFKRHGIPVDAEDKARLVLFPELDENADVHEITVLCWDILGVAPETMMCATSRMVIKRKGASAPAVVPCTLLPYDSRFELGPDLTDSSKTVKLNHPHCAKFCVLGGGSCSAA